MTNAERYISELRKVETDENRPVVEGIIKGFCAIMTEACKDIGMDPDAYSRLDEHRRNSRMSAKAFIESVGKAVIESSYDDKVKAKMLDNLSRYARLI